MLAVRSATRCAVNCVDDPPVLIGETTGAKGDSNLRRAPNRSLFEPARPAVSRRELVIAGEFSRLFVLPGKPQRDQKSVGPSLRILNCLACYSPRGSSDQQSIRFLSDFYLREGREHFSWRHLWERWTHNPLVAGSSPAGPTQPCKTRSVIGATRHTRRVAGSRARTPPRPAPSVPGRGSGSSPSETQAPGHRWNTCGTRPRRRAQRR
jgi:hypothetical protein